MKGSRLPGAYWGAALCVLMFLTADAQSVVTTPDEAAVIDNQQSPELSIYIENTSRRRNRRRGPTLLAPHERPERPRLV